MRLPRDLTSAELIKRLAKLGYQPTRQSGSHVRLSSNSPQQHHLTVPLHDPLRVGTLATIILEVAEHQQITRDALVTKLFG